jgi:glycosyltransferase involved in cell wall biosynthesis
MQSTNRTKLGLNLIVGPGEAQELERCMESFHVKSTFDQVVICTTSGDESVRACAEKYADVVVSFDWTSEKYPYGNFGGARNAALDATTTDWVWWLDADDVCMPHHQHKLQKVRDGILDPRRDDLELFFVPYVIRTDDNGKPLVSFMRERIFRRTPKFRWRRPVHEQITPPHGQTRYVPIGGDFAVTHMPNKPSYCSAARNLKILEHEVVTKGTKDTDLRYFYGRDLLLGGRVKEGVPILEDIIAGQNGPVDQLFAACLDLIFLYAYGRQESLPLLTEMTPDKLDNVERWCRQALSFSSAYAEPFVILGDVYYVKGNTSGAEKLWRQALTKSVGDRIVQFSTYYGCVPSQRLAALTLDRGDLEEALYFNRNTIKGWKDVGFILMRKKILKALVDQFTTTYGKQQEA